MVNIYGMYSLIDKSALSQTSCFKHKTDTVQAQPLCLKVAKLLMSYEKL